MPHGNEGLGRQIQNLRERIRKNELSPANREAILRFADCCESEGLGRRRILKYLYTLQTIARRFQSDFRAAGREEIEALVRELERSDYSEWTKHDFRVTLKKFYRWLRGSDAYPPEVRWLRSTMRGKRAKLPDELLTQDEVRRIISAAPSVRDRAFVAVLYESGCRIGEVLNLKIKHIQRHEHGFQITVHGGKGSRRLLLICSVPHLTEWLNTHPKGRDREAPVWATSDYHSGPLSYERMAEIIRTSARRAGVAKAVNPHNFRHTRATHLANHLTEAQMKAYFGWVQGSDMASTYVHLSGRDVDNALLKLNNIAAPEEDRRRNELAPRSCPACKLDNPATNRFCSRCGTVVDEGQAKEIMQRDLERKQADDIMDRLLEDEQFREILKSKLRELGQART